MDPDFKRVRPSTNDCIEFVLHHALIMVKIYIIQVIISKCLYEKMTKL